MKMNRLSLLISLLFGLAIAFSACTKEQYSSGPVEPKEEGGEAYAAFRFNAKSITRGNLETEFGTADENKIHQIWMLLYNTGGILEYAYDLKATNYSGGYLVPFEGEDVSTNAYVNPSEAEFVTVAKQVKSQDYQLVVIANPGKFRDRMSLFTNTPDNEEGWLNNADMFYALYDLRSVNGSRDNGSYERHQYLTVDSLICDYGTGDNVDPGFFMSNANGVIQIPKSALQPTAIRAERAPVPIAIDRAVAKVIVNGVDHPEGTPLYSPGGRIDDLKWTLVHLNRRTFLIRRFAHYFNASSPGTYYTGDMETYDNSGDRWNTYAEDPNYTTHPNDDFYDDELGFVPWNTWDEEKMRVVEENWKYATENTLDFKSQSYVRPSRGVNDPWFYYVTHVCIHARILFDDLMNGSDPLGDPSGDYFSYRLNEHDYAVFTYAQVIDWITHDSFPQVLRDANIVEYTGYVDQQTGTYIPNPYGTSNHFFPQGQHSLKPAHSDTKWSMAFLKDGINVYYVPIRHFAPDGENRRTHYGHFGVVRNNVYRLTINSIKGPGTPTDNAGYISADITINPWYQRDQPEDL